MPKPFMLEARDVAQAWKIMVPEYRSASYSPLILQIQVWEDEYAVEIEKISMKRSANRWANYVDAFEVDRARERLRSREEVSLRFGVEKKGHGYHGPRGDFCLVGGSIKGRDLTLMYRSLELIGGFAYDLTLIHSLGIELEINWRRIMIFASHAHVFALKGNSNEALFPKLQKVFSK